MKWYENREVSEEEYTSSDYAEKQLKAIVNAVCLLLIIAAIAIIAKVL